MLFTAEEAAELLGVGRTTIYNLFNTGELLSVKIGRSRRVPRTALEQYVAQRMTMAACVPMAAA
jgi:excisionase family DNA binding protein